VTGRLRELGPTDLAFTPEEAAEFWQRHGTRLDPELADSLLSRTEGWAAGMRLAALSLDENHDPDGFVVDFLANDRGVADYLTAEVLSRLPADARAFMLSTSVVDAVCGDLAYRLTGRSDAAALLYDLEQRNALVVRLGLTGQWFRYHDLLRAYLRAELTRHSPDQARALTSTAARWFADEGRWADALDLAVAAEDAPLAGELLRWHGLPLLLAGSDGPVRRTLAHPPAELAQEPVLTVHRALAALENGDLAGTDEALAVFEGLDVDPRDGRLNALHQVALLHRARLGADVGQATSSDLLSGRLRSGPQVDTASDLDPDVRLVALANRGTLRLWAGDYGPAREDLTLAANLARSAGLDYLALYCLSNIPGTYTATNEFTHARRSAEEVIAYAGERGWGGSARLAYSYVMAGYTAFLLLDPVSAAERAAQGLAVLDTTVDVEAEGAARSGEAIIAFDDPKHRRAAMARLQATTAWLTTVGASPALIAMPAEHELRMCLRLGEWAMAEQAIARAHRRLGDGADVAVMRGHLAYARGRSIDARRYLRPVLDGNLVPVSSTAFTTAWLIEALIAARSDHKPGIDQALRAALAHAAPTGAGRPFFDAGPELRPLLADLRGRAGPLESFLDEVWRGLARVDAWQARSDEPRSRDPSPRSATLTEREVQVLRELPSMQTLAEIAAAQSVSTNTVKTHVRSIYAKLGVSSRRKAVAAARAQGIV
jgi:LuxR family maltose regulon positive regulatory protein